MLSIVGLIGYDYYYYTKAHDTENKPYKNDIGYIEQEKALLNDKYKLCDDGYIQRTYNGARLEAYFINKKHFRYQLKKQNSFSQYQDSGYLNFRFLANCEGNAGWFEVVEINLDKQLKHSRNLSADA